MLRYRISEKVVATIKRGLYYYFAILIGNNHKKAQFRNGLRFSFIFGLLKVSSRVNYLELKRILPVIEIGKTYGLLIFAIGTVQPMSPPDKLRPHVPSDTVRTPRGRGELS